MTISSCPFVAEKAELPSAPAEGVLIGLSECAVGCINMGLPFLSFSRTHHYLGIFGNLTGSLLCSSIVFVGHSSRKMWLLPPNMVLSFFLDLSTHTTVPSGIHPHVIGWRE